MKQSVVLAALTIVRLALGSLMQAYVIAQLGVGVQTDALVASSVLPQLALALVANALVQVLVPLFSSQTGDEAGDELRREAWTCFVVVAGIFAVLAFVLGATASLWVRWLAPGFSIEATALAIDLTRIQLVGIACSVPFSVLWSLHCARGKLVWAELAPTLSATLALALLVWAMPRYGVYAAAVVTVVRVTLDLVLLVYILGRWNGLARGSALLGIAWRRLRYLLVGSAYYGTEPLINQVLASFAPTGSLATLFVGQQIYNVSGQIISKALAAPLMPKLSVAVREQRWRDFRAMYHKRLLLVSGLATATLLFVLVPGDFVLSLLAGRIAMSALELHLLWQTLLALGGVCLAGWTGLISTTALHSTGDTRTPMILSVITYTIYTPIKFLAFARFGLLGLAATMSVYYLVNLAGQLYFIERMLARKPTHDPQRKPLPPQSQWV